MSAGLEIAKASMDVVKSDEVQKNASALFGMLWPYIGIKKKALDEYLRQVEDSNLSGDAKIIAILSAKDYIKRLDNQRKIAAIAKENAAENTVFDISGGVSQEWFDRYMDSAGFVSDEQVQDMWGKILAKEFENPGSTPHSMIRILSEISPKLAQAFRTICSMQRLVALLDDNGMVMLAMKEIVVPYYNGGTALESLGLRFEVFNELETLGLIKFDSLAGYVAKISQSNCILTCVGEETWELKDFHGTDLPIGCVLLTEAGRCLQRITPVEKVPGFQEIEHQYMLNKMIDFQPSTPYSLQDEGDEIVSVTKSEI